MPLNLFYTMVQKSQKWPKTQIKGSCLKPRLVQARPPAAASLEAYIQKRSERVGVKPPTVYGSNILSAKNDGQFCGAHITIDHASASWFSDASFWIRPVYAREWVFRNQQ